MIRAISLAYHDVVRQSEGDSSGFPGPGAASYKLDPKEFDDHLTAIARAVGHRPATVFDLAAGTNNTNGTPPFLLTFDDGGSSACTCIADALEKFGWHGHFFIPARYVGAPSFVSRRQVVELRDRGHVVGTHSYSHPKRISSRSTEMVAHEWRASVDLLSDLLGEPVTVASVPGGYYSRRLAEAAASAGIRALFTLEPTVRAHHVNGCLILGRYTIRSWTTAKTAAGIAAGQHGPRLAQLVSWNLKKMAKSAGGELYLALKDLYFSKRARAKSTC